MGKPMSMDLRERVVAAVDGGMSRHKAAERFGVSVSSAIRWTSRARRLGRFGPGRKAATRARAASRRTRR